MAWVKGIWLALILLAVIIVAARQDVAAQEEIRISGMVIGSWYANDFDALFELDPLFTYSVYPLPPYLGEDEKRRLHRVYYPRTRQDLIESYDVMVFDGALITHFTPNQFRDLDYAFREGRMSAIIAPVVMWFSVLEPTILRDVVPISQKGAVILKPYLVRFNEDADPVFLPFVDLGIDDYAGSQYSEIVPRQGATVWAEIRSLNWPWLVSWRPGGSNAGMQWVVAHRFDEWWQGSINPYAMDAATNMILYSMGRDLISDVPARRETMRLFTNFYNQKTIILSMIEWVDAFGANTLTLTDRLVALDSEMEDAIDDYLEQDYPAAISFLQSVTDTAKEISRDVVRLKDEALLWIYLVEWLAVSGTTMVSAFVIWSLMIRKRAYKEVNTTRFET